MMRAEFSGWFQCRLATDPDPHDEPRGVSGYVNAYADEPDLDRILHWQAPSFTRVEGPAVGVSVHRVTFDGTEPHAHPLVGARVSLLDGARFEGRNGVIADDGQEPIYPFHLGIEAPGGTVLQRHTVPSDPDSPYREFYASGVQGGPDVAAEIAAATGIKSLASVWQQRLAALQARAAAATGVAKVGLQERIDTLSRWLDSPGSPIGFFGVRMVYDYALRSAPVVTGWSKPLGVAPSPDVEWTAKFWLGGWDADALCGFCSGALEIPAADPAGHHVIGARGDDRDALMRRGRR